MASLVKKPTLPLKSSTNSKVATTTIAKPITKQPLASKVSNPVVVKKPTVTVKTMLEKVSPVKSTTLLKSVSVKPTVSPSPIKTATKSPTASTPAKVTSPVKSLADSTSPSKVKSVVKPSVKTPVSKIVTATTAVKKPAVIGAKSASVIADKSTKLATTTKVSAVKSSTPAVTPVKPRSMSITSAKTPIPAKTLKPVAIRRASTAVPKTSAKLAPQLLAKATKTATAGVKTPSTPSTTGKSVTAKNVIKRLQDVSEIEIRDADSTTYEESVPKDASCENEQHENVKQESEVDEERVYAVAEQLICMMQPEELEVITGDVQQLHKDSYVVIDMSAVEAEETKSESLNVIDPEALSEKLSSDGETPTDVLSDQSPTEEDSKIKESTDVSPMIENTLTEGLKESQDPFVDEDKAIGDEEVQGFVDQATSNELLETEEFAENALENDESSVALYETETETVEDAKHQSTTETEPDLPINEISYSDLMENGDAEVLIPIPIILDAELPQFSTDVSLQHDVALETSGEAELVFLETSASLMDAENVEENPVEIELEASREEQINEDSLPSVVTSDDGGSTEPSSLADNPSAEIDFLGENCSPISDISPLVDLSEDSGCGEPEPSIGEVSSNLDESIISDNEPEFSMLNERLCGDEGSEIEQVMAFGNVEDIMNMSYAEVVFYSKAPSGADDSLEFVEDSTAAAVFPPFEHIEDGDTSSDPAFHPAEDGQDLGTTVDSAIVDPIPIYSVYDNTEFPDAVPSDEHYEKPDHEVDQHDETFHRLRHKRNKRRNKKNRKSVSCSENLDEELPTTVHSEKQSHQAQYNGRRRNSRRWRNSRAYFEAFHQPQQAEYYRDSHWKYTDTKLD